MQAAYLAGQQLGNQVLITQRSHHTLTRHLQENLADDWNHPLTRAVEIPSANMHASGATLAAVAAVSSLGKCKFTLVNAHEFTASCEYFLGV